MPGVVKVAVGLSKEGEEMMSRKTIVAGLLVGWATVAGAGLVFNETFENKPFVASGNPDGWSIFGAPLDDRGTLHNSANHSPTSSTWVAVSWTGWGWGATTISNEFVRYDVMNNMAEMSVWMRATNDFGAGSIALTLYDADGTQWRSSDASLFQPTTAWTEYQVTLGGMQEETAGSVPGLDYTNITSVGFLAFTSGQSGQNQLQFDDFTVTAIPEPGTMAAMGVGGLLLLAGRRRMCRGTR